MTLLFAHTIEYTILAFPFLFLFSDVSMYCLLLNLPLTLLQKKGIKRPIHRSQSAPVISKDGSIGQSDSVHSLVRVKPITLQQAEGGVPEKKSSQLNNSGIFIYF